jgi:hypothetical protein
MTRVVVPAIITAVASLIVAVISVAVTAMTSRRVARLTGELERQKLFLVSELEEQKAARNARRDYEYEAKKRLYAECEPLLFEAVELAESARYRVVSLARSCQQGDLRPDGSGWLSYAGYYFQSTAYYLLAPMTSFKILQHRLTAIDLGLEPRIRTQYELLKLLFLSFTEDHALARYGPKLEYHPDQADPGEPERDRLLGESPRIYRRQGFYLGTLDVIVQAMINEGTKERGDNAARCRTFGEFRTEWARRDSTLSALIPELTALFGGFHPREQPALWRILITQYLLYDAFLHVHRSTAQESDRRVVQLVRIPSTEQMKQLNWRTDPGQASDDSVREPFVVARAHIQRKLSELAQTLKLPQ